MQVSFKQIKEFLKLSEINVSYIGLEDIEICGFCSLDKPKKDCITWVKNIEKNSLDAFDVSGSYIFVAKDKIPTKIERIAYIITDAPKTVFFSILDYFWKEEGTVGIAESAVVMTDRIGQDVSIGENSFIGRGVCVGNNVQIGNNCSIMGDITIGENTKISDNVVIKNSVQIGNNCTIQALTAIGEDGFGYYEDEKNIKTMIKHHGGVIIEGNVFVGSHTNIARGTIGDTIIKEGVKIAPSTHIGHNNILDKNVTLICSQSYGSVHIKENAYVVGSIIKNQSIVGKNAFIGMGSTVIKDVEDNKVVYGSPASIIRDNK